MTKTGLSEENIPNSYYLEFGDGKYIGLAEEDTYTVKLHGTDTGTFTFIIEEITNGQVTDSIVYSDVPVSPSTTATMTIETVGSAGPLQIDTNGDGQIDNTLESGEEITPVTQLKILKGIIKSLNIRSGIKRGLIERIDSAIKLLKLGKTEGVIETLTSFQNQLKALAGKKLDIETALRLLEIIEVIKNGI